MLACSLAGSQALLCAILNFQPTPSRIIVDPLSQDLPLLDILSAQDDFVVINKPGGVLTQAPPGIDSIELRLFRMRQSLAVSPKSYVGVPHRLDRPVSGAMVLGLNKPATRRLAELFQKREVQKIYWAVVRGSIVDDAGTWSDFMRKIPDQAKSEVVAQDHPDAQLAILNYQVIRRANDMSWLRIELETGRTHQIRMQCAARSFPILGDEQYGSLDLFGPQTVDTRERWIALHARRIAFAATNNADLTPYDAPLSSHWKSLMEFLPELNELDY